MQRLVGVDNVPEWSDMSARVLLSQGDSTIKIQLSVFVQSKVGIIINSLNVTCSRHDIVENYRVGVKQQSLTLYYIYPRG